MRQVPSSKTSFSLIFPFFLVIVLDIMSINIIAPVLAPLVNNPTSTLFGHGASNVSRHVLYGIIMAMGPLCYAVGAPVLGYISDYSGRRRILLLCVLGSLFGMVAYIIGFLTASVLTILLGKVVTGFTSGSLAVAQSAIADVSRGPAKAKNIGMIAVAMTVGLIAGPLLGGVLSDPTVVRWFSNTTPFYAGIILSMINLIVLMFNLRETHQVRKRTHSFFKDAHKMLFKSHVHFIMLTFFVFELGWSLYFQSLALLLSQDFKVTNKVIGFFASYVGLLISVALIYGVRLVVNRFKLVNIVKPSFLLGTAVLLVGFFFNSLLIQWLIAVPIAIMVAFCYSILITMGSDKVDSSMQGLFMGTSDALLSIAFAISAFTGGVLAIKSAVLPELIAAVLFVIGFCLFPLARKQYQEDENAIMS